VSEPGTAPIRVDETYGGQAVIEGVMMRDRRGMCIAVRTPDGSVICRSEDYTRRQRDQLWSWPVFRGMAALYDSLRLGIDALLWSAEAAGEEGEKLAGWQVALTMTLSLGIAVGLFMVLPTVLVSLVRSWVTAGGAAPVGYGGTVLLNIIEGLVRATILVAYIASISRISDIARVLAYHGAEHRVIHASEAGADMTVEGVRPYPVLHPRCGTSFLLYVVMVSVLVFSFFGWPNIIQRMAIRLSLLPLVAGISYEWVRLAGRSKSPLVQLLCQPGIWLQRLTTRTPDDDQVEVALRALAGLRDGTSATSATGAVDGPSATTPTGGASVVSPVRDPEEVQA